MFKTAIIGCGAIAQMHAEVLSARDDVSVAALCDIIPERAKALCDTFSFNADVFTDYIALLDTVKPDVVHICTPHYLHAEMVIAALKRNINVMVEKPVCINEEQIREMIKAEKESKAAVCVSFQNRTLLRNRRTKELIESGRAGKLLFASARVCWKREAPYYTDSHWRGFKSTEGGGVMINQAIHTLDLMLWLLGEPKTVTASVSNLHLKGVIDVEDTANGYLTFSSGARGLIYATTANWKDESTVLTLKCENMVLSLHDGDLFIDGEPQHLYEEIRLKTGKDYWGVGHQLLFAEYYSRLAQGRKDMPVSLKEAWRAVRVLLTMYASHGQEINLIGSEDI